MSNTDSKLTKIPCAFCGRDANVAGEEDAVCESCCIYLGDVVCEELKLTICCLMQRSDEEWKTNKFFAPCLCTAKGAKLQTLKKERKVYSAEEIKKLYKWPIVKMSSTTEVQDVAQAVAHVPKIMKKKQVWVPKKN